MTTDDHMVCIGKKRMTLAEAVRMAKERKLHHYRCPVAGGERHYHVTSARSAKASRPDRRDDSKVKEKGGRGESPKHAGGHVETSLDCENE